MNFKKLITIAASAVMMVTSVVLPIKGTPISGVNAEAAKIYQVRFPPYVYNTAEFPYQISYKYSSSNPGISFMPYPEHKTDNIQTYAYRVYAAKAGEVVEVNNSCSHEGMVSDHPSGCNSLGNYVKVKGGDGIYYWYCNLKKDSITVSKGDKVAPDIIIGQMGNSGRSGQGRHVYFNMTTGTTFSGNINVNRVEDGGQVEYTKATCSQVYNDNYKIADCRITFHRNFSSSDTTTTLEYKCLSDTTKKFGYYPSGNAQYKTMADADKGFGEWTRNGYKMLGWSDDPNATTARWSTYSNVTENWIINNCPGIHIYAVWEKIINYSSITEATYLIKNSSTGTYMNAATASNGAAVSLGAKKDTNPFKMKIAPASTSGSYYIYSGVNSKFVLNPYADTPADGTKVTLYEKNTDGTQYWKFVKSGSGYIIQLSCNSKLALTASGTNVVVKTNTGAANQIWYLEDTAFAMTSQPSDITAEIGETVEFSVGAKGKDITYQWQYSMDGGSSWSNCSKGDPTTDTLSVEAVAYRNGYRYRCIVKSGSCKITSTSAILTVNSLALIEQPEDVSANVGDTVRFSVSASNSNAEYQW